MRRYVAVFALLALVVAAPALASNIKVEKTATKNGSEQLLEDSLKRIKGTPLGKALLKALDDNKCEITIQYVSKEEWAKVLERKPGAVGLTTPSADGKSSKITFPDPFAGAKPEDVKDAAAKIDKNFGPDQLTIDGRLVHELLHALIHCVAPGLSEADHHRLFGSTGSELWEPGEHSGQIEGGLLEKFYTQLVEQGEGKKPEGDQPQKEAEKAISDLVAAAKAVKNK